MISRKLLLTIACMLIGEQAVAMKRAAQEEIANGLPLKKQKNESLEQRPSLHQSLANDDLFNFWIEAAYGDDADVNAVDQGGCPLILSVILDAKKSEYRKIQFLDILLENGANIHVQTPAAFNPLDFAITEGEVDLVKKLIVAGADPNCANGCGRLPLHQLCNVPRQLDIARLLAPKTDLTHQDKKGNTVLHNSDLKVNTVEFLVLLGADVSTTNNKGKTPYESIGGKGLIIKGIETKEAAREQIIMPEISCKLGNPAMFVKKRQHGLRKISLYSNF